jgi:hypothetical protein
VKGMKKILLLYSLITLSVHPQNLNGIKQGIEGNIYIKQGNQMPAPGQKTKPGKPTICTVFIYQLTKREQTTETGTHYSNIQTKLIAQCQSNAGGYYSVALPVGNYSVFISDNGLLYANSYDGKGNINPVKIVADSLTRKDIVVSSNAVY